MIATALLSHIDGIDSHAESRRQQLIRGQELRFDYAVVEIDARHGQRSAGPSPRYMLTMHEVTYFLRLEMGLRYDRRASHSHHPAIPPDC